MSLLALVSSGFVVFVFVVSCKLSQKVGKYILSSELTTVDISAGGVELMIRAARHGIREISHRVVCWIKGVIEHL